MIIDNISSFMYSKLLDGLHCIKSWYGKYCRCIFCNLYRCLLTHYYCVRQPQ